MHNGKTFEYKWLMLTTLVISGCSIIYEVLISSVSAYLVGDSIKQFSITIGLYMSAMGIGSYLSKYIKKHLFDWFVWVELGVGLLGGLSSLVLFMAYSYLDVYTLVMYGEILAIGTLVGLEIPLLTRIIEENTKDLRMTISHLFSFDYIGGLVGSIAFPLFLLPQYGYFTTAALVGTLNIGIALFIIFRYRRHICFFKVAKWLGIIFLVGMVLATLFSENAANQIEDGMYRDHIIYKEQTPYQYLVMTKHKDDVRLFINGNIQFSSVDEYRYHESLVHIPMAVAKEPKKVLILGGGDGLAVREVLKYGSVEEVTLVDLDKDMVTVSSTHHEIVALNEGALMNEKVTCVYEDAFKFLEETTEVYDVIIVDLPDPNDEGLNKLYTNVFYRLCGNRLSATGAMSIQATSPYYAKEAFWCIYKTLKEEGFFVEPYHVQVPSFGDWGFQLVTKQFVDEKEIKVQQPTKFLNEEIVPSLFDFAEDQKLDLNLIESNTLTHPKLITYYLKAVENWR